MDSGAIRTAGYQLEGLLLEQLFKPLASAFGEYGDVFVGAVSQNIAVADRSGFGALLSRLLSRDVRDGV